MTTTDSQRFQDYLQARRAEERRNAGSATFRSVREALTWFYESDSRFLAATAPQPKRWRHVVDGREESVIVRVDEGGRRGDPESALLTRATISKAIDGLPEALEADQVGRKGRPPAVPFKDVPALLHAHYRGLDGECPPSKPDRPGAPWTFADMREATGFAESTLCMVVQRAERLLLEALHGSVVV